MYYILSPQQIDFSSSMGKFSSQIFFYSNRSNIPSVLIDKNYITSYFNKFGYLSRFLNYQIKYYILILFLGFKSKSKFIVVSQEYLVPFHLSKQKIIVHDVIQKFYPRNKKSYYWYKYFLNIFLPKCSEVFFVSKTTRRHFKKLKVKKTYYPTGVPVTFKKNDTELNRDNLNEKKYDVLWIGTFASQKNLDFFIKSMESWLVLNNNAKIKVAIKVPERDLIKLSRFIFQKKITNHVDLYGDLTEDDLNTLYSRSKIFISTSSMEGFCMPIIEALYLGCKTLITDIDIFNEIYSQTSLFYKLNDTNDFHKKLSLLIRDNAPIENKDEILDVLERNERLFKNFLFILYRD